MKKPEQHNLYLHIRFALIFILSITVITLDVRSQFLSRFRYYIESALYPVLALADAPHSVSRVLSDQFKSHSELIEENEKLSAENFKQRADILKLKSLESENEALRRLVNSPARENAERMFAEVIDVDSNPYLHRVIVNRGTKSKVYEGMPVITDQGLVGQVMTADYSYSRVLLITDPNCSVPVINGRSNVRAISSGSGSRDELLINNVPRSADNKPGDILYTSGIGGVYPKGYPVAVITSVGNSELQPFALIKAKPVADIDKMRYVLMFWSKNSDADDKEDFKLKAKQPTDGKIILRQQKIKDLINALSQGNADNRTDQLQEQNNEYRQ